MKMFIYFLIVHKIILSKLRLNGFKVGAAFTITCRPMLENGAAFAAPAV
jgi:hypothetical protein